MRITFYYCIRLRSTIIFQIADIFSIFLAIRSDSNKPGGHAGALAGVLLPFRRTVPQHMSAGFLPDGKNSGRPEGRPLANCMLYMQFIHKERIGKIT